MIIDGFKAKKIYNKIIFGYRNNPKEDDGERNNREERKDREDRGGRNYNQRKKYV